MSAIYFNDKLPVPNRVIEIRKKEGAFHSTVPSNPSQLEDYHLEYYGGQEPTCSDDPDFFRDIRINPFDKWTYLKKEFVSTCPVCNKPAAKGLTCSFACNKFRALCHAYEALSKKIYELKDQKE